MTALPYDDDYRELIEGARDALRELLDDSNHDSWLQVRIAYGELRTALARDDKEQERHERHERTQDRYAAEAEATDAWRRTPAAARESLLLRVLGDERLILRQLTSRLNAELGYPTGKGCSVYENNVRNLATRMLRAGQLEREAETFNKTHTRYRYFRKRTLEGPIIDLERTYQEGGE
jgi:ribonuclease D